MDAKKLGQVIGVDAHEVLSPTLDIGLRVSPAPDYVPGANRNQVEFDVEEYAFNVIAADSSRPNGADLEAEKSDWDESEFDFQEISFDSGRSKEKGRGLGLH